VNQRSRVQHASAQLLEACGQKWKWCAETAAVAAAEHSINRRHSSFVDWRTDVDQSCRCYSLYCYRSWGLAAARRVLLLCWCTLSMHHAFFSVSTLLCFFRVDRLPKWLAYISYIRLVFKWIKRWFSIKNCCILSAHCKIMIPLSLYMSLRVRCELRRLSHDIDIGLR